MNDEVTNQILKKFFNKRYVVQKPQPSGLEVIQARMVTLDELKELAWFAYSCGIQARKKKNDSEPKAKTHKSRAHK